MFIGLPKLQAKQEKSPTRDIYELYGEKLQNSIEVRKR